MQKKQSIPAKRPAELGPRFGRHEQTVISHHQQHTVKTIFDPDVLQKYGEMVPDAPERVLKVFEQNSATERYMVENSLNAMRDDNRRRDWMAFAIIIGGIAASAFFAYLKVTWLSGAALVAIVFYAVIGYLQKSKPPPPPTKL
jgi:uncharacterized membrane protein